MINKRINNARSTYFLVTAIGSDTSIVIQRNDNSGVKNNLDTTAQEIHSFLEVFHD